MSSLVDVQHVCDKEWEDCVFRCNKIGSMKNPMFKTHWEMRTADDADFTLKRKRMDRDETHLVRQFAKMRKQMPQWFAKPPAKGGV